VSLGLTRTQRRKLQCLGFQEKKEKELENQRDEAFNQYGPMVPQGKKWRVKTNSQPESVKPVEGPVRPVTDVSQTGDPTLCSFFFIDSNGLC
jgi:hypothetical protein